MADDLVGVGRAAESIEKMTREVRELVLRLLGPAADAAGERLADWINPIRSKNFDRIVQEVLRHLRESHIDPRPVELKVLIPILQHCSLETNDDLVSRWAGLLASAAAGLPIHPSYPNIIAELTPGEARLLNLVDEWHKELSAVASEDTSKVPGHSYPKEILLQRTGFNGHKLLRETGLTEQELPRVMFDLGDRHSLVHFYSQKWRPNLDELWQMTLTPVGEDLLRVCRGPNPQ